jgi:hypothetical protein
VTRRTSTEIAADLEVRASKLRADADRRLSVAADGMCQLLFDAEKALRALGSYCGPEGGAAFTKDADGLALMRETRWRQIKEKRT